MYNQHPLWLNRWLDGRLQAFWQNSYRRSERVLCLAQKRISARRHGVEEVRVEAVRNAVERLVHVFQLGRGRFAIGVLLGLGYEEVPHVQISEASHVFLEARDVIRDVAHAVIPGTEPERVTLVERFDIEPFPDFSAK